MKDNKWLQARKNLLQQIKFQVASFLGESGEEISDYKNKFLAEFQQSWRPSSKVIMMDKVWESQLVLVGDFHPFHQSQRSFLRLVRACPKGVQLKVALECFSDEDDSAIQSYLEGEISENDFLEKVNWKENWGFPFSHYRPILDFAKDRGFHVYGVNQPGGGYGSLDEREVYSSKVLAKLVSECVSHERVMCLFGEIHLAEDHLPKKIKDLGAVSSGSLLKIFQNNEALYFELCEKGLESKIEILQLGEDRFCIFESPPWVQWQSYLIYLEQAFDSEIDEGEVEDIDLTDHFYSLVHFLLSDLDLSPMAVDVSLYTPAEDLSYHLSLSQNSQIFEKMIESDRSFYWKEKGILYVSRMSVNHTTGLAASFIHFNLMGVEKFPGKLPDDFEKLIWIEAMAFALSKMVNNKRKPDTVEQLKAQHTAGASKGGRGALLLALDQRMKEAKWATGNSVHRSRLKDCQTEDFLYAAKVLGSQLGEWMYKEVREGVISRETLNFWLRKNIFDTDFREFYYDLVADFTPLTPRRGHP